MYSFRYQRQFQSTIAKAAKKNGKEGKESEVIIDGRGPGKAGSIHQKFTVMRKDGVR
jgi:hypothetical protein